MFILVVYSLSLFLSKKINLGSLSGPIPDGADAVVQIENTELVADTSDGVKHVRVLVRVPQGLDIRQVVNRIICSFVIKFYFLQKLC